MTRKYTKNHLMNVILILSIFLSSTLLLATTPSTDFTATSSIDKNVISAYNAIRNIQKQLFNLSESTYTAKRNNQDLSQLSSNLKLYILQIDSVNSQLSQYSTSKALTANESLLLKSLITSTDLLRYLAQNLEDQLATTNLTEEFRLINSYTIADSFINQILLRFTNN